MVRKLLFIILALGMSMCSVSRAIVLQDDFDGDTVDTSKWQLINGPDVSITQSGGQVFFDRSTPQLNYLVTVEQFDPAVAPLTITGSVVLEADDADMDVWTRADIIANTGGGVGHVLDSGIRINFWANAVDMGYPPNLDILEKTAGVWPADSEISDGANIPIDDEVRDWDFVITDDGTTITAKFTQTSNPANSLTLTGTSTTHFATNYVAFTVVNGYLNDVTIIPKGKGLELAINPEPTNKAADVPRDVVLGWKPGIYAAKHNVYFGTSFADVNTATPTNHPNVQVSLNHDANTYDPVVGLLEFSTTYYWRIDEVNAPPSSTVYPGDVWSFTTEPIAYQINNITATASSWQSETMRPEKTVDNSGLDPNTDQHSVSMDDMWLSKKGAQQPTWIQYEFDKVYRLHEMWVWNHNYQLEPIVGFGLKNVTIQYSTDNINWPQLSDVQDFNQASGMSDYTHNTTVDFSGVAAKYVKLTVNSNWGAQKQYGLSEVRFFRIPVYARGPNPKNGQTNVALDTVLYWRTGREAATHKLYISTSKQEVIGETITPESIPVSGSYASYAPLPLGLDTTYYWKVNEVNGPDLWKGDVWSFSTTEYLSVEDFEDYNNSSPYRVFDAWKDYGTNNSGATVGYFDEPYAETIIIHGGRQSMPLFYDNDGTINEGTPYVTTGTDYYSQTDRTWDTPQDWTAKGVEALVIWFRGYLGTIGGISYDAATSTYTMTGSGTDINDVPDLRGTGYHDEFHFAYKELHGYGMAVIAAKVESIENTNEWAKAGVMIRQTLDADSPYVMVCVTPEQSVAFQYRNEIGGEGIRVQDPNDITAPHWVRITLNQDTFTAEHSEDGQTWLSVGEPEESEVEFWMTDNTYIGLALTSRDPDLTCEAVFSNVSTEAGGGSTITPAGSFTQSQDIGILSNDAESLYVILEDDNGSSYLYEYTDEPNATQIYPWQELSFDLSKFRNEGVNLEAVKMMSVGIGDPGASLPSGEGKVYIDDIRLYRPGCFPSKLKPLADFSNNCVVDAADIEIMAGEWLSTATEEVELVADLDSDDDVDFADYAKLASSWLEEETWP